MSEADDADVAMLQERLAGFIRAFGLHQPEHTPCGQPIPVSEAHALIELARDAPFPQAELGRRLLLEKSTISRLVDQLVARGWVERGQDPRDRRATSLSLTAAGRQAAANLANARRQKFAQLFAAVPETERETVLQALKTLTEALK
jgi:DNA-binding MarR family transcriptional regulator